MIFYLGLVVVGLSLVASKLMLNMALEIELIDQPNERSSHTQNIPKGGGVVFATLFTAYLLYLYATQAEMYKPLAPLLISGPALFGLGWIDDRLRLSAKVRLLCHFIVAAVTLSSLTQGFTRTFGFLFIPEGWPLLAIVFLLLYIVWFVNIYNFMDGVDGLAGGVGLVAALTLSALSQLQGANTLSILYLILACSLTGFIWFNWSPARFFMGDSGAYFLGASFAVLSLIGKAYYGLSMYPTVIVFSLFIVDATYTLMARISKGYHAFAPHQEFGFHRLILRGWSHSQATSLYLAIICFWSIPMAVWVWYQSEWSFPLLCLSYLPVLGFNVYIKAGRG
jgi:Fuc2NAc and GlcNAc transferase